MAVVINTTAVVRFKDESSHTTVKHVSTRPVRPATLSANAKTITVVQLKTGKYDLGIRFDSKLTFLDHKNEKQQSLPYFVPRKEILHIWTKYLYFIVQSYGKNALN